MEDNSTYLVILTLSTALATLVYSFKNVKKIMLCGGCSTCEQDTHDRQSVIDVESPNMELEMDIVSNTIEKKNQIDILKTQINEMKEALSNITITIGNDNV